ncbi:MAG: XdhC family protein [Pelosinus sp.]|nr:XdhC family protein [Pelosinus sp.]
MIFDKLLTVVKNGDMADIFTIIDSSFAGDPLVGKMMMVYSDKAAAGELDKAVMEELLQAVKNTVWVSPMIICQECGEKQLRIFWDKVVNKNSAIVLGGGHISQPLVQILALLDFAVTVIDDRPEFANTLRFPEAKEVICDSFQQALKKVTIDSGTAVIIVTRGHRYDLDCLRVAMHSNARYLGMIGSRKRVREALALLEEEGAPLDLKERLKAPIGLAIHAETPAEIAVSIAAEVVSVFRGGYGGSLSKEEVRYGSGHTK